MGTAYLTYINIPEKLTQIGALEAEAEPGTETYRFHEITSADDPELAFAPAWQRRLCATHMASGAWYCLVAYERETGRKVAHVWTTTETTRGLLNGVMNLKLAPDEVYVWDLFIDASHRGLGLGQSLGRALIRTFDARGKRWGLTHVLYDNAPSILWHHMFGFSWMQLFNYIKIGDRIWLKVPYAECPRFGPLSPQGRHSMAEPDDPFGGALVPAADAPVTRLTIKGLRRRESH